MPRYSSDKCEDEQDACHLAEVILRQLGYLNVQKGPNVYDVNEHLSKEALLKVARNAERIARWARLEAKE